MMLFIVLSMEVWFISNLYAIFVNVVCTCYVFDILGKMIIEFVWSLWSRQSASAILYSDFYMLFCGLYQPTAHISHAVNQTQWEYSFCALQLCSWMLIMPSYPHWPEKGFKYDWIFLISNNHVLLGGRNGHKGGTPELFLWLVRPLKRYPLVKKKGLNQDWCFTTQKWCQSRELIYIQGDLPFTFFN